MKRKISGKNVFEENCLEKKFVLEKYCVENILFWKKIVEKKYFENKKFCEKHILGKNFFSNKNCFKICFHKKLCGKIKNKICGQKPMAKFGSSIHLHLFSRCIHAYSRLEIELNSLHMQLAAASHVFKKERR